MPSGSENDAAPRPTRAAIRPDETGLTDGQLLECFIRERSDAAFAVLVRRHGPMVWAVCRRVLGSHHDAEDAFQASFVVLARKAASVAPRELMVNWLYGVAYQTARKARATRTRRSTREKQVTALPERPVLQDDPWRDLRPVLDHELSRLPSKYRSAIVLCDLEGKSRKEAACLLALPEGTLSGRLTRGRSMLAKRVARHGLALSAGTIAAGLAHEAVAAGLPPALLSSTVDSARLFMAGQAAAAGLIPAKVVALANGATKAMPLMKLKLAAAVVGAAAAAGIGIHVAEECPLMQLTQMMAEHAGLRPGSGATQTPPNVPPSAQPAPAAGQTGQSSAGDQPGPPRNIGEAMIVHLKQVKRALTGH